MAEVAEGMSTPGEKGPFAEASGALLSAPAAGPVQKMYRTVAFCGKAERIHGVKTLVLGPVRSPFGTCRALLAEKRRKR